MVCVCFLYKKKQQLPSEDYNEICVFRIANEITNGTRTWPIFIEYFNFFAPLFDDYFSFVSLFCKLGFLTKNVSQFDCY